MTLWPYARTDIPEGQTNTAGIDFEGKMIPLKLMNVNLDAVNAKYVLILCFYEEKLLYSHTYSVQIVSIDAH